MKKIFLMIVLGLIFSTNSVYAVDTNSLQPRATNLVQKEVKVASRAAAITQFQASISQDLQKRAQTEITRRLDFLNDLVTRLNDFFGVKQGVLIRAVINGSSAEKAGLQSQIQTQIDGLNALQAKISGDTDNVILRADVKSIISNYYIFMFFRVKVNLLVAADKASATTDNLNLIYTKLQTRVSQAKTDGNDVTSLNAGFSDMNAKLTDANTQITAAQTVLTPLSAQGYPGNKTALAGARTKIETAVTDLKAAYEDALQIRNGLKGLKIVTPQASSSAH